MKFRNNALTFVISLIMISYIIGINNAYAIPPIINYQGYLTDINGIPLNQTIDMTFKIYDQLEEGIVLWQEEHKGIVIEDGIFKAYLGEHTPITEDLFVDDRFIGVTLGTEPEMQPRSQLSSSPYAFIAAKAISVPDSSITSQKIATQAISTEKIADNAVTSSKIADSSITNSKISEHTIDITKLNFTPLMKEVDPQVGEMNTYDVPKWDGTALVSGSIVDTGENVGISVKAPAEALDISGAIKIGNTTKENPGTIRWTNSNFEGFDGSKWVSFTNSNSNGTTIQLIAGEEINGLDKPAPVYIRDNRIILDQSEFNSKEEISGYKKVGQTFQTDAGTSEILKFDLYLEKTGNQTSEIRISLFQINDGKINEMIQKESWAIDFEKIINGWNTFEKQLSVDPLSEYAITLEFPLGGLSWHYQDEDAYLSGNSISNPKGYSWSQELNKDYTFKLYSENRVYKSKGEDVNVLNTIGFAISNASVGEKILIQTSGIVDGFKDLKIGRRYYIQDSMCGIDVLGGSYNKSIGIAVSDTKLQIIDIVNSGINWKGSWQIDYNYKEFDAVEYGGESFICNTSHRSSSDSYPSISMAWEILASKGVKGDRGEKGLKGDPGSNSSTISIGPNGYILLYEKIVYTDSETPGIKLKDDESNSLYITIDSNSNQLYTYRFAFCYWIKTPGFRDKAGIFIALKNGVAIAGKHIYTQISPSNNPKVETSFDILNLKNGDIIEFRFDRVSTKTSVPYELCIHSAAVRLYMNIKF